MHTTKRARKSDEAFEILSTMMKRTLEKEDVINQLRTDEAQRTQIENTKREALLITKIRQLESQHPSEELILENKRLNEECQRANESQLQNTEALRMRVNVLLDREIELDAREDAIRCTEERLAKTATNKGRSPMRMSFVFTYTGTPIDPRELNAVAAHIGNSQQIKEIVEITETDMHFCRLSFIHKHTEEFVMSIIKKYHHHMRAKHPLTFAMSFSPVFTYNTAEPWRAAIINNELASPAVRFARAPLWTWYSRQNNNYAGAVLKSLPDKPAAASTPAS